MSVFIQCVMVGLIGERVPYEFAEFLFSKGVDIEETNTTEWYRGYTLLFWAVESGDEKLVHFLVENGANVNATAKEGKTSLLIATEAGKSNLVEIHKANGAK